jgi:acetyl esterase
MGSPHPQVVAVLERAARSGLPTIWDVSPFVARRLYRDTRGALSPAAPEVGEVRLKLAPGPDGPIPLRAFRPKGTKAEEILPALVYFHGGGWVIGDLDTHDVVCRQLANGARCAVFSVDYRLAPECRFPAAVEDCVAATRWIAAHAEALAIDPARIAVGGDSAGGNLATVVALAARDAGGPSLCYQLLIYPGTDQRQGFPSIERNAECFPLTRKAIVYFRDHYLPRANDWLDWRASPLLADSLAGLPPAYLLTAGFDVLVDEGRAYARRLAKEGVATEYKEYPDMVHGFLLMGGVLDTANVAVEACCGALKKAFGGRA